MRYDWMQIILFEPGGEEIYGLLRNGLGPPAARIGGEDLKGIAAQILRSVRAFSRPPAMETCIPSRSINLAGIEQLINLAQGKNSL